MTHLHPMNSTIVLRETNKDMGFVVKGSDSESASDSLQVITFLIQDKYYAMPIQMLTEIATGIKITRWPASSPHFAGIMNLRGQIIGLVNVKYCLGMSHTTYPSEVFVLIMENRSCKYGLLVDEVRDVLTVSNDRIEKLPEALKNHHQEMIAAVIKTPQRLISLIEPKNFGFSNIEYSNKELFMAAPLQKSTQSSFLNTGNMHSNMIQLVTFSIQNDEFAVHISEVQEINKLISITHVPRAPKFVEGVINLRGQMVPVISLRERFNRPKIDYDKTTRIIVIHIDGKRIGLIVDAVSEVLRLPPTSLKPAPVEVVGEDAGFVKEIAEWNDRLIIVLNLQLVLSHDEVDDIPSIQSIIQKNTLIDGDTQELNQSVEQLES